MSDRLPELLRQRALLQEHLAWLDREIAVAREGRSPAGEPFPDSTASAASAPTTATALPSGTPAPSAAGGASPDAILDRYRADPGLIRREVRRGCLLYLSAALALLAVALAAITWLTHRH